VISTGNTSQGDGWAGLLEWAFRLSLRRFVVAFFIRRVRISTALQFELEKAFGRKRSLKPSSTKKVRFPFEEGHAAVYSNETKMDAVPVVLDVGGSSAKVGKKQVLRQCTNVILSFFCLARASLDFEAPTVFRPATLGDQFFQRVLGRRYASDVPLFGDFALKMRGILSYRNIIRHGNITDWVGIPSDISPPFLPKKQRTHGNTWYIIHY